MVLMCGCQIPYVWKSLFDRIFYTNNGTCNVNPIDTINSTGETATIKLRNGGRGGDKSWICTYLQHVRRKLNQSKDLLKDC